MKKGPLFIAYLIFVILFSGCKSINSSIMFKTPKNFKFDTIPSRIEMNEYKLAANDIISFQVYTNDGFKLVDLTAFDIGSRASSSNMSYSIDLEGYVKIPVLGRIQIAGRSVRETELYLEELYSKYYNKPFIILNVSNRKVFVFRGSGSAAQIYPLTNNNSTLIEAISAVGGISENGKAYNVKIIRGDLNKPKVYSFDLSTINGTKYGGIILQNNDIIYVEPRAQIARTIITESAPYISILSSLFIILRLIDLVKGA